MTGEDRNDGQRSGVASRSSPASFDETVHRLIAAIEDRGLRVFDVIDHRAAAAEVGLRLRPTKVVIFGSPAAGTPLMVDHPTLALELPLRILVWQADDGQVTVNHLDPGVLGEQFGIPAEEQAALAGPGAIVTAALGPPELT
jgi:uncharacterized protein (DUF302 family)